MIFSTERFIVKFFWTMKTNKHGILYLVLLCKLFLQGEISSQWLFSPYKGHSEMKPNIPKL